jgi:hypothetical protein
VESCSGIKIWKFMGGWCSLVPTRAFGVGLWKNIKKWWNNFFSFTRIEVGDGTKISFWHDQWCGEVALKVAFLVLFGLACAKDTSIVAILEFLGGSYQWNVNVFASFYWVLHSVRVRRGRENQLLWASSKKGLFNVKSYFCLLVSPVGSRFPSRVFGEYRLLRGQ